MNKRILLFGKLPPPYIGPAVATKIILDSSLSQYFEIIHFDLSHQRNINDLGKINFSNIITPFLQYFKLINYILRFRPACVYMPSQQSTIGYLRDIPFILISKLFRIKIILHFHGSNFLNWYNNSNNIVKWSVRITQKMINGQIVLGNNLCKLFTQFMPKEKIFVIPNGANYDYNKNINDKTKIVISFLGNFVRTKGIIDYIKASTLLPDKYYDQITFQMAGYWAEKDCELEIRSLLKTYSQVPLINKGPVLDKDKKDYLINSDIFVYPTLNDAHPFVIVEAMAAGLPIISTDVGAITESVIDGVNGFIVDKDNPKQIADKIKYLLDNPKMMREMGENSRMHYLSNFTEERLVENFTYVFNTIIGRI